jgi:hypothetical protein
MVGIICVVISVCRVVLKRLRGRSHNSGDFKLKTKLLGAAMAIGLCMVGMSPSASAGLIFETDNFTGTSNNRNQLGIMTRIEVASDQTITNIAVDLDLDAASGNLNFVIFNSISGALLF